MPARTVRVHLHNQTREPLVLQSSPLEDGDWTPGLRPPGRVEPGTVVMFRSESESGIFTEHTTGTEGRAIYTVNGDATRTIYMHWNNPFVGSNSFHVNTDNSHYALWAGGAGNDATVEFVLRDARRVSTSFSPEFDGFHFRNHWVNTPYTPPFLRDTPLEAAKFGNANNGLCGGMIYLALDYFYANQAIPAQTTAPPDESDPMFLNLVDRLFDTFTVDSVSLMLKLMDPLYPDSDEEFVSHLGLASGRAAVMAHVEWPLIRADIDAGRPSPLTIITVKSLWPGELGKNHQILVYAYEARGHRITLHVYDPNQPDNPNITMSFDDGDIGNRIVVEHNVEVGGRPIYCFTRMEYGAKAPAVPTGPRVRHAVSGGVPATPVVHLGGFTQTLEWAEEQRGRRLFDVLPDCGEHEFDFTVTRQRLRHRFEAIVENIVDPEIHWYVDGLPVPAGEGQTWNLAAIEPQDMLVPEPPVYDLVVDENGFKALVEVPPPPVRGATITVGLASDRLTIENRPEDGSYYLPVRVGVRQRGADKDRVWFDERIPINGREETIPGLNDAIGRCIGDWLLRLREEQPSEEAMIAAFYAQLGRPWDPIWDPDPIMLKPEEWLALADPVEDPDWQWLEPLTVDPGIVEPVDPGLVDPGLVDPGLVDPGEVLIIVTDTDGDDVVDTAVVVSQREGDLDESVDVVRDVDRDV